MYTEVKSASGIALVPIETRHLSKRRVYLRGEITMELAEELDNQLALLNDASTTAPIDLFISSPGGELDAMMYIYDMITAPECAPIRAHGQGVVASAAALIFAACPFRDLLPGTRMMIHQPLIANSVKGNCTDIHAVSRNLLSARDKMEHLLAKHTGQTIQVIRKKTAQGDCWFSADEAVAFGLADKVSTYGEMLN